MKQLIIFFFRGLYLELICLKNKFVDAHPIVKVFVITVVLGGFVGNFVGSLVFPSYNEIPLYITVLERIDCIILGSVSVSLCAVLLLMTNLFVKHTIEVGKNS